MAEDTMDKKHAALEATLELIAEQGFHGTPMSQIAKKANIGVGTIYRYFSGKEDLINELYIYIKQKMTDTMLKNYDNSKPIHESFKDAMKNIIRYMTEHPMELSFGEQYSNSPLITQATKEQGIQIMEPIRDLFCRAKEKKLLKELPDEVLFIMATGAMMSLAKLYNSAEMTFDEARLDIETDAIWDMIKK